MKIEFDRDWLPRSLIGCSVIVQEEYFSQEIRQKVISCSMYYWRCVYNVASLGNDEVHVKVTISQYGERTREI